MTVSLAQQPSAPSLQSHDSPAAGRVVVATINRLEGNTGVHTHTAALCHGLRAEGVQCDVVTPFDNPSPWLVLFSIRPLVLDHVWPSQSIHWYRRWHGAALRTSLRRYLLAHDVSHIIAQCPVSAKAALDLRCELGNCSSSNMKISMVCHFNHSEAQEYKVLGQLDDETSFNRMLAFEADVMQKVDQVIYVSEWISRVVEEDRQIKPRASTVIHNGIESQLEPAAKVSRADIHALDDDLVLINVGTLEHRKNQLGLLDLFASLHRLQPRVKLILVGDGPDRQAIESKVIRLGLSGRVSLLGRRTDVTELMKLADLYVHYSIAENCPIVILEAARAGLPWAAIPAAGIRELQDLIGGCIAIDSEDPAASAEKIRDLLEDPSRLTALGVTSRNRFLDGFTRRTMVRAYLNHLTLPRTSEVMI